jgi:hypothetical protein
MGPGICPIWQTTCELASRDYDFVLSADSPRAGGKYVVKGIAEKVASLTEREKALLTSWLIEQRRNGIQSPEITSGVLGQIANRRPLSFSEKINRAMVFTEGTTSKIGAEIELIADQEPTSLGYQFMAQTEL